MEKMDRFRHTGEECVDLIEEGYERGGRVIVHCIECQMKLFIKVVF